MISDYHAKYYAHELTRRCPPDSAEKLAGAVASAQVDLNPHQVDAALFAFKSPLSKGALLADEVGLGKTIEAGLVLSQKWAERKRRILVITPSNLRKQWYLKRILPHSEVIREALRAEVAVYPEIALRELIANALIHQDFTIAGAGPMIEVFDDRIEFTNPGGLLPGKTVDRLIGATPESRNEVLAAAFRRYRICEERGTGFQKVVTAIELFGLPPLAFFQAEKAFKVILYAPRKFADMSQSERIEACYQHAVLKYLSSGTMTNTSLRERLKMQERQRTQVSNLIRDAVNAGRIKRKDPDSPSSKFAEYVPYWA